MDQLDGAAGPVHVQAPPLPAPGRRDLPPVGPAGPQPLHLARRVVAPLQALPGVVLLPDLAPGRVVAGVPALLLGLARRGNAPRRGPPQGIHVQVGGGRRVPLGGSHVRGAVGAQIRDLCRRGTAPRDERVGGVEVEDDDGCGRTDLGAELNRSRRRGRGGPQRGRPRPSRSRPRPGRSGPRPGRSGPRPGRSGPRPSRSGRRRVRVADFTMRSRGGHEPDAKETR